MVSPIALSAAVERFTSDNCSVALEGFTHLIPFAAGHEIIRQQRKNLTLIRMTPDVVMDQMIGMGTAEKVIFSYAGNPGVGLLRRFRDAVENQWPHKISLEEHSHAAMANAFDAGAAGLPCAIFRGYAGAELSKVNKNIKSVICPFTQETLAAVPALRPDVTFIHAQKADRLGNILISGITGVQKQAVMAAKKSVVTVEEIVEKIDENPNACILPHWTIDAICHVPGGAHPSYAQGYYERDNASYLTWDEIAKDRKQFLSWMKKNVLEVDETIFQKRIKGERWVA